RVRGALAPAGGDAGAQPGAARGRAGEELRTGGLGRARAALLLGSLLAAAGDGFTWAAAGEQSGAVTGEVAMQDGRWRLLRGGRHYTVHGAGVDGGSLAALAAHGGNTVRTWSTRVRAPSGRHVLDEALHHGLTVALCLDIG